MRLDGLQLEPPRRVTIVESIIEQLVAQIQNGTLKAGDRLPSERQLMEILNVSRSSVREALQGLAAMDLVEGRAGEGTFIKEMRRPLTLGPDISTLSKSLQKDMRHHVNRARFVLEDGIVALAAQQQTEVSSAALTAALERFQAQRQTAGSDEGWKAHDQLHLTIAELTGNPVLVRLLYTLIDFVPPTLRKPGFLEGRVAVEQEIHVELCRAIARGDADTARAWMRRHMESETEVIDAYYGE